MERQIRRVAVLAEQLSGALGGDDGVYRMAGSVDYMVVLVQQLVGDRPAIARLHAGQDSQRFEHNVLRSLVDIVATGQAVLQHPSWASAR
ncbi:hypothetical protein [Micromonospora aurantiaca (nom. illeg.)]|uniref:hypothetical protein n=1 Tax=Micromonospora aurantiaca (nom. illeg.) TaxID=47850 RepID=UPI00341F524F